MTTKATATERLLEALGSSVFKHAAIYGSEIITRAKKLRDDVSRGVYHDFKTEHAFPKHELCVELEALGLSDVARRVQEGEFDDEDGAEEWAAEMGRMYDEKGGEDGV